MKAIDRQPRNFLVKLCGILLVGMVLLFGCDSGGGGGDDGSGTSRVSVPNVAGMTQAAAQNAIVNAGLTVGTVTSEHSDSVASGSVISQNPAAGASVDKGTAVSLVVSSGPEPAAQQFSLTVAVVGSGSVTLDPPGGVYDEGSVVTLTAVPAESADGWPYDFTSWSGDLSGSNSPATLTMNGDRSVTATFSLAGGLRIKDHDYHGPDYRDIVWITASVRNGAGDYIADLGVNDFQLTEYIIARADNSIKAEASIDLAAFAAGDNDMLGLAKTIRGGQPLDLVILLDNTGTMTDFYPALKTQLAALVNEMIANHVDFRLAYRGFDSGVGGEGYFEFHGPQEADALLQKIDAFATAGELGVSTAAYDALLFTPWLGFRENARKVCVVIADVVPRTVYGAYWYGPECATRSAAELFLQESDIELYYAQRENYVHGDLQLYYQEEINPRAGDAASGFAALKDAAGNPLATRLGFPFDRQDLKVALGIDTAQTVVDTEYVLSWNSSFDRWNAVEDNALIYHPEDYELRVVLKTPDPDQPGEFFQASCTYPIEKPSIDITLNVTDEEGTPSIDIWADLNQKMGERDIRTKWQLSPVSGQINAINLQSGTYNTTVVDSSASSYTYSSLRAVQRDTITISQDGMAFDMTVPVADQEAELYRTRGLLKDIGDWRLPGDPFQAMVDEADAWLDDMLGNGLSWEEMTAIKRFQICLAGFANAIEYSQQEAEKAIQDFDTIVQNFRDIVEAVEEIGNDTSADFAAELASGAMEALMALMGQVQFTLEKEALEEAIAQLLEYAVGLLTQDLRDKIIEQLPLGDYNDLLQIIVNTLIDADFGDNISLPDWDAVISAVKTIALDQAIEAVQNRVVGSVADIIAAAIQDLPVAGSLTEEIKTLVQAILTAFLSGDINGGTFSTALENFASSVADDVINTGKDFVGNAVANTFDAVADALTDAGVDADISGLLVGMARDLTYQAIPVNDSGSANFSIDTDAVVSVLIKYGVYYVILKDYCIDDIQAGLDQLLSDAKSYFPAGEDRSDWVLAMTVDFDAFADRVEDLQTTAWDALRLQNAITEWAQQMETLCNYLDAITGPLDTLAALWPDLQDTADDVHAFIAVLDGMQILANATSFGLKVDSLDTFGNQAQPMHQALFY